MLALSACGANGGDDDSDDNDPTEVPSETTTPEGDELTEPGTELELGETAFIQWKKHKKESIMGFRDNGYVSPMTGTMAPKHHTRWVEAMDDSLESYLRADPVRAAE